MDADRRDERMGMDHRDERMGTDRHENPTDHGPNRSERGKGISLLLALLGLWMVGQAFLFDLAGAHFWSDVLVGALLIGVGGYNYSRQANERFGNSAVALIAVAAGLWLIAAPFLLGDDYGLSETTNDIWLYNDLAVGLLAMGLGAYSAYMARDHPQQDAHRTKA